MRNVFHRIIGGALQKVLNYYQVARSNEGRSTINQTKPQDAHKDMPPRDRIKMMNDARVFEQNDSIAERIIDTIATFTIGRGLQFIPGSVIDPDFNKRAKDVWDSWTPYADIASLDSFEDMQGQAQRCKLVDGDVFVNLLTGESNRPRIQLMEAHRCSTPNALKDREGKDIIDGVERDLSKGGRATAYYFPNPVDPSKYERIPQENMIHVMDRLRPSQVRGVTIMAQVLKSLHDLRDLKGYEMKAAKFAASRMAFVKNQSGEISRAQLLRQGGSVVQSADSSKTEYYKDVDAEVIIGRPGDEIDFLETGRPSVASQQFWDYIQGEIAWGIGLPKELIFSSNLSGAELRAVLDISNTWFRIQSDVMAKAFRRVYLFVIENEFRGKPMPADWKNVTVQPPKSITADIGRNSTSMIAELMAGIRSPDMIAGADGLDAEVILRKKAKFARLVKDLAIEFDVDKTDIVRYSQNEIPPQEGAQNAPVVSGKSTAKQ
jgi:capsid protein